MDDNENQTPDETTPPTGSSSRAVNENGATRGINEGDASRASAGNMIREAREKAGIAPAKVCADLRISVATLEALEAGQYEKLAGGPYVRAMLVSLSRHLRLDSKVVLKAYAEEAGQQPAPVQVSPYKDDSGTHAKAHKQIFILILAVLLFILLLIMGKVSTSAPDVEPELPPVATDTLLSIDPGPDYNGLQDDSTGVDTTIADTTAADTAQAEAEAEEEDEVRETRVRLTGITDSVWVRILPAGSREISEYLRSHRPLEFTHNDAITFITRQGRTVRVSVGDSSVVPTRRRFVVDGAHISF